MFFYSFLKYYSIVCLDFFPWGGGFFDTFDWPFVSHPGEFDQKILKFVKSPPFARSTFRAPSNALSEAYKICKVIAPAQAPSFQSKFSKHGGT